MSYASARAWQAVGQRLPAIGALIQQNRETEEQKRIDAEERNRRRAAEDLRTDIALVQARGGRGPVPLSTRTQLDTATHEQAPAVTTTAPPPLQDAGAFAGRLTGSAPAPTSALQDPSAFLKASAAPASAAPALQSPDKLNSFEVPDRLGSTVVEPDSRYAPVGDNAYIMRPEAAAQVSEDARIRAAERELEIKEKFAAADRARRLDGVSRILMRNNPQLKPDDAKAEAAAIIDNDLSMNDLHPKPPSYGPETFSQPEVSADGTFVQFGNRGTVKPTGVRAGSTGDPAKDPQVVNAKSALAEIRKLDRKDFTNLGAFDASAYNQAVRDIAAKWSFRTPADLEATLQKVGQTTYAGGAAPAAPVPGAAPAPSIGPAAAEPAVGGVSKSMATDTIATWKQQGISPEEIKRRVRAKGW